MVLGRRNLSPIPRIAITEKYRPIYEKQARENQSVNGGDKKSEFAKNRVSPIGEKRPITHTDKELAKLVETVGVSTDTYSKDKKILDSDNEDVKEKYC